MAILQCIVIAALCSVAAAPGGIVLPDRTGDWVSIVYMALFAGARAPARPDLGAGTPAADPDRDHHEHGAGLRGPLRGAARRRAATARMLLGGALVLAAMLIVELVPRRKIEAEVPHIAV